MPALGRAKKASLKAGPPGREGAVPLGDTQLPGSRLSLPGELELAQAPEAAQLELVAQAGVVGGQLCHPGGQPVVVAQQRAILQPALHGHHVGAGALR